MYKRGAMEVYADNSYDHSRRNKRTKLCDGGGERIKVLDLSNPLSLLDLVENTKLGKYGSVSKDVEALIARKMKFLDGMMVIYPHSENESSASTYKMSSEADIVELENRISVVAPPSNQVVIIDSDEEEIEDRKPFHPFHEMAFPECPVALLTESSLVDIHKGAIASIDEDNCNSKEKDKGLYIGVEDDLMEQDDGSPLEDDGLSDIWKDMNFALEYSKDVGADHQFNDQSSEDEGCDHSFVLKDDIGYVCRVCGVVQRAIDTIFDFQYIKASRLRSYRSESRHSKEDGDRLNLDELKLSGHGFAVTEICAHPRHKKQMKPHQLEGFNFLLSNLVTEDPGGCILAHAPGSGKTFMIISFMQSFLAQYPDARPLVVLPKGILSTWKKEFQRWQIEDIPLLDLYTTKADSRIQQLEVLKQWVAERSILFLGYKQFSSIITGDSSDKATVNCQEILLKCPSILILDEGHTPRNEDTDVLHSLSKIRTPRKVVLSGTLYQNHVREVFTILNLVRPKFLKLETSRSIKKRIMSRVQFSGFRKQLKGSGENVFFELVEYTLQQDDDSKRKEAVIKDLREMTSKVLHYYRGDFLDDLPGLVDYTVLLRLSPKQKSEMDKLKKAEKMKFKRSSVGSALYTHPRLKQFSEGNTAAEKLTLLSDERIDDLIARMDLRDGVKAKFFFNMLTLCDCAGEKLLVFSQYLLPLKFLERLAVQFKGWALGREIFMISGDSSAEQREISMEKFNNSPEARVFFGSIKACGEGISLVGASRIIILDVHLNPSVSRQAIGRAFRPGQEKKVYTYRLVAADSLEEEDHLTCFKKEQIAKRWFEWNEYSGSHDFSMEPVDLNDSGDPFLESPTIAEDVKTLFKR